PPDERNGPPGWLACEWTNRELPPPVLDGHGHGGEQRDPCTVRDHLRERREARGSENPLPPARPRAGVQRLGPGRVAPREQKDVFVLEVRQLEALLSPERMPLRQGGHENVPRDLRVRALPNLRLERQQASVERPLGERVHDVRRLLLAEDERELGVLGADL